MPISERYHTITIGIKIAMNQATIAIPQESVWRILMKYHASIHPRIGINATSIEEISHVTIIPPKPILLSGVPTNFKPTQKKKLPISRDIINKATINVISPARL